MTDDPRALIDKPPAFHAVRFVLRHWADHRVHRRVQQRYANNPRIAEWLERSNDAAHGVDRAAWNVWLERPFRFRSEEYGSDDAREPVTIHGGNRELQWDFIPAQNEVLLKPDALAGALGVLTPSGGHPADTDDLTDMDTWSPVFHVFLHPIVAELLDPKALFPQTAQSRIEAVGAARFAGRDVLRVQARVFDWDVREPFHTENLWVADDYEFLIDVATGVILRFACRDGGQEFSIREMTDIAFDEPIDPSLFEPPAGAKRVRRPLLSRLPRPRRA